MREQAMRYCLIALIFAMGGMYAVLLRPSNSGFLPPATPEELQISHADSPMQTAATGSAAIVSTHAACPSTTSNLQQTAGDAYTPCDSPIGAGPTDSASEI